jgi:hypothetical protein
VCEDDGKGRFKPAKDSSPASIVLWGGKGLTTWFTDRPVRDAGTISTGLLIAGWSRGIDSFKADPPNAALVIHDSSGESQVYAMEILAPAYEPMSKTVAYQVRPLASGWPVTAGKKTVHQLLEIPARFGSAVLFIDPSNNWCLFAYQESCASAVCDPTKPTIFNQAQCNAQYNQAPEPSYPPLGPQCSDGSFATGGVNTSWAGWTCKPPATLLKCQPGQRPSAFRWYPPVWRCESEF